MSTSPRWSSSSQSRSNSFGASWISSLADLDLAPAGVDRRARRGGAPASTSRRRSGADAAQDRLDARDELARVERLRQVVVGADLEADDLVDVLVAGGQHQDRHVGASCGSRRQISIPSMSGSIRSRMISAGASAATCVERGAAGRDGAHGVAGVLQVERDERRDRRLVLDDQDRLRAGRPSASESDRPRSASACRARSGARARAAARSSSAGARQSVAVDRVDARLARPSSPRSDGRAPADGREVDAAGPDRRSGSGRRGGGSACPRPSSGRRSRRRAGPAVVAVDDRAR